MTKLEGILKLAADSKDKLRSSDVDRVMQEAHDANVLEAFRQFLSSGKFNDPYTLTEVQGWQP